MCIPFNNGTFVCKHYIDMISLPIINFYYIYTIRCISIVIYQTEVAILIFNHNDI